MSERYSEGFENVGTNIKRPRIILIDDELDAIDAVDALKAPLASPTFTGTVVLPATTSIDAVSGTEIAYLNGVTSALQTQIDAKQPIINLTHLGTVAAGVSVVEYGDDFQHTSLFTITNKSMPAVTGSTNQRIGTLFYTFPAGEVIVKSCKLSSSLTQVSGNINAATPEIGVGTTIGTGSAATLTGAYENVVTGLAATNANGAIITRTIADQTLVIGVSDSHALHVNAADNWSGGSDAGPLLNALIIITWTFMDGALV